MDDLKQGLAVTGPAPDSRPQGQFPYGARPVRVIFFVSVDWYFCLHWLELAQAVQAAGFSVSIMTEITDQEARICEAGLRVIPIRLSRKGMNPLTEARSLFEILGLIRRERPDLIHCVAQKPILYGALAGRMSGVKALVGTLAGMGFLFTSESVKARILRPIVLFAYRLLLGGPCTRVIVQNPDDRSHLAHYARLGSELICGAGVDLSRFRPTPEPPGPVTVMLASRMLWDKGVAEFVEAARSMRRAGSEARFVLVGKPDAGNPSAVPESELRRWHGAGDIEWWGFCDDMPGALAQAHIVCLPSYREGLPTILIEAAAAGRALVATDVPGCREVVRPGLNGILVGVRDAHGLAQALERLVRDAGLRSSYGRQSRLLAEREFGIGRVTQSTLEVYASLLRDARCGHAQERPALPERLRDQ